MLVSQPVKVGEVDFIVHNVPATPTRNGQHGIHIDVAQRMMQLISLRIIELGWVTPDSFKFLRKTLGISSSEMGALLQVSKESVSHWETGKHAIPVAVWTAVAGMVHDQAGKPLNHRLTLEAVAHPPEVVGPVFLELAA